MDSGSGTPERIVWAPQPGPQTLLLTCPVEDVLFGGARGGGKTDALLGDWISHASLAKGKGRGIILRRTMPQLEEIIFRSNDIMIPIGARWIAGSKTWVMPCGSTMKMRWLERDQDAEQYQGHSYTYIGIDEAGNFPDPAPIDKMRATMRSPHGVQPVMRLTANPGGVGHEWLKERYIAPAKPLTPHYDNIRKTWRVYIPSRVRDNVRLMEADPGYLDRLRSSGPPWLVRAWLDGDWDASAGEAFFEQQALLVDGQPVELGARCDYVFAVIDSALKDGLEHDGTAVLYCARDSVSGYPLVILDWDVIQIKGALLEAWLPSVADRLEYWARETKARMGSHGLWIEDKASGTVLIQQAQGRGMQAHAIEGALTAMGKEGRALNVSGHIYSGRVKLSRHAYEKVSVYREQSRNHLLSQVCGFRLGTKTPHNMDLLDCFTYAVAISLGNSDGY